MRSQRKNEDEHALPNGWAWADLSLVTLRITDGTHHSPQNLPSGDFMYVTAKNIRPWGLDLSDITFVGTDVHREIYSRSPVEKDDVLYIKDGATTGLAIVNPLEEQFSILSSVALLKPIPDVLDSHFLKNWLNSPEVFELMTGKMTGTAIRRLTLKTISSQRIPLPPFTEQKRIVEKIDHFASRTFSARASINAITPLIARYKSTLFEHAFSGKLTAHFRKKNGSASGALPKGWKIRQLGDMGEIQGGIQVGKSRQGNPRLVKVPYLRVANVQKGFLNLEDIKHIAVTPAEKSKLLLVPGDILMNEGGDRDKLGRGWVWQNQIAECIHQNHVFRIRLHDKLLPPEYVSHFANEHGQQYFFDQGTQTTNLASISKGKLAGLPIPVPPTDEAVEIARIIGSTLDWLDRLETSNSTILKLLNRLDKATLVKAFRGALLPQDPSDTPASTLVEIAELAKAEATIRMRGAPRRQFVKEGRMAVSKTVKDVLATVDRWMPAQEVFQRCGVSDGTSTDEIEQLYLQLRELDASGALQVEAVKDRQGRKLYDRIRLKAA